MKHVYHVSEIPGIKQFAPRKYWHVEYGYSGPVIECNAILSDAQILNCVYACCEEDKPFYFAPSHCHRFMICRHENTEKFHLLAQLLQPAESNKIIVFNERDRFTLMSCEFSVYVFNARDFSRLPTGEYAASRVVEPIEERCYKNAYLSLLTAGYQVLFVPNPVKLKRIVTAMGFVVRFQGMRRDMHLKRSHETALDSAHALAVTEGDIVG